MVYLRLKKSKNAEYAYLVKSVWDKQRGTSRQVIVKYLGRVGHITENDIPPEYKDKINMARASSPNENSDVYIEKLYETLTRGDLDSSMAVYKKVMSRWNRLDVFFENILRPVLYKIGQRWADGILDIATEHVASNVVQSMIRIIQDKTRRKQSNAKVMLCMPAGEEHKIPADILEVSLTSKGYVVYNLGSLPAEDVLGYIANHTPDIIFVTASLQDNRKAAERLCEKIKKEFGIPVVVGGYAFSDSMDLSLSRVPSIIKNHLI